MNKEKSKKRWPLWPSLALAALAAVIVAGSMIYGSFPTPPQNNVASQATHNAKAVNQQQAASATVQCRTDAVNEYMKQQGFQPDEYVVGESNINHSYPELSAAGSLHFWQTVDTRAKLQSLFTSTDPGAKATVAIQVKKFPEVSKDVLLNADNWEIFQAKVATKMDGNTGFSKGSPVVVGTRSSAVGDAGWLYVDPTTCRVIPATADPVTGQPVASTTPPEKQPVGFIRVGCANPVNSVRPTHPKPPTTPVCPPGQTGTPPNCKDTEASGPAHNPQFPEQQKPNPLPAAPADAQPTRPALPPAKYTPPPVVVTPAPVGNIPAPTPIETPRVIAPPEPAAPAPSTPVSTCSPAPGKTTCD